MVVVVVEECVPGTLRGNIMEMEMEMVVVINFLHLHQPFLSSFDLSREDTRTRTHTSCAGGDNTNTAVS